MWVLSTYTAHTRAICAYPTFSTANKYESYVCYCMATSHVLEHVGSACASSFWLPSNAEQSSTWSMSWLNGDADKTDEAYNKWEGYKRSTEVVRVSQLSSHHWSGESVSCWHLEDCCLGLVVVSQLTSLGWCWLVMFSEWGAMASPLQDCESVASLLCLRTSTRPMYYVCIMSTVCTV